MPKDPDSRAARFEGENSGSMSGFLAEEDVFDRRTLWRLGPWGAAAVGAVILAVYANNSSIAFRRDQIAASDLGQQAQQIQWVAKESQNETRRLASTIDTLTGDRDRLYSRVTVLEHGLESVTGAVAKQNLAAATPQAAPIAAMAEPQPEPQNVAPAPLLSSMATAASKMPDKPPMEMATPEQAAAVVSSTAPKPSVTAAATPSPPLVAAKSMMAPPDAAAGKLIEPDKDLKPTATAPNAEVVASAPPADNAGSDISPIITAGVAVQRTEFGVDVGGANSVGGLRALWRGLLKSRANAPLATLRPMIVIRESSNGLGMQLRLVAGPLSDAAAAAKICAGMMGNDRPCQTSVFEGQRLVMGAEDQALAADPALTKPAPPKHSGAWRRTARRVAVEEPQKPEPPSTFSALFGRR
jgi:hypothetical protein